VRIAMIGTRGVPATHGGFETAVEEIGSRIVEAGHEVVVYCRNPGQRLRSYRGMTLHNLPAVRTKSLDTLSHSGLSALHAAAIDRPDAAVLFNAGNAPYIPVLHAARIPFATHMDGLEWKRAKWAGLGARYYRWAESFAARRSPALIADALGIQAYLRTTYQRDAVYIAYGAPSISPGTDRLPGLGEELGIDLPPDGYHLVVARFEPENHLREIVDGYVRSDAKLPLVVVGDTPYSDDYQLAVKAVAEADDRVTLAGSVWDQTVLDQLYTHCRSYVHGHSVGGTNPSLLRAMGAGAPVTAYDVVFNRETTGGHAKFFTNARELATHLESDDARGGDPRGEAGREYVTTHYRWDDVAASYLELCHDLAAGTR
jgi:glycosyltransferase involved in cell wall biosynthesis